MAKKKIVAREPRHATRTQSIVVTLISVLSFMMLLGWAYFNDNKYTHDGLQPIAGSLILNEQALRIQSTYILIDGWHFYPDQLLSPSDFEDGVPNAYMQTISIGQQTNQLAAQPSATSTAGSASYHLTLVLPEGQRSYTLVLPEIFSSYRLYLDDQQLLAMGAPEESVFSEKVGRKTVTFTAGGEVSLLLSVTNRSHYAFGMVYPPTFGTTDAVNRLETSRLLLGCVGLLCVFLCGMLALYLAVFFPGQQEIKISLFFYTAVFIMAANLHTVIFYFFEISPQWWYGFELFAIYGVYLLVVLLQGRICNPRRPLQLVMVYVLGIFSIVALVYGMLPGYNATIIAIFGQLSEAVKALTVVYLLYCAVDAVVRRQQNSNLLLFSTLCFSVAALADRMFSTWEPIVGGWPTVYGETALIFGLGTVLWLELSEGYRFKITFAEEKRRLVRLVSMQKAHYAELADTIEDLRRQRHDERHHLQMLYSLYESTDYDKLGEYLSDYAVASPSKARVVYCKNLIVDSMVRYYQAVCERDAIAFSCQTELPEVLPLTDVELSILLGNLLENGHEAARKQGVSDPFLSVKMRMDYQTLSLLVENSFATPLQRNGKRLLSSKREGYGIGTESVRALVEGYGGSCDFADDGGVFRVMVSITAKGQK